MAEDSSTARHVGEIDEFGYTVVENVLDAAEVDAYLSDTRRLERDLPTVIANSTTVVKGFLRPGHAPVDGAFRVRATVVGSNPKSEGTKCFFGLDAIVVGK